MSVFSSVSSVLGTREDNRVSSMSILEIDARGNMDHKSKKSFQYFPETITDSRSVNWIEKNVVGGSHPIYQWTYGSARTISFEVVFTNEIAPPIPTNGGLLSVASSLESAGAAASSIAKNPLGTAISMAKGAGANPYSVNIPAALAWLRAKTYPLYGPPQSVNTTGASSIPQNIGTAGATAGLSSAQSGMGPAVGNSAKNAGSIIANAPPKLLLVMPNSGIASLAYGKIVDSVSCIMTSCNVTYEAFFRTGHPRIVTVSLEFAEIVQTGQHNWGFVSRDSINSLSSAYTYVNPQFESSTTASSSKNSTLGNVAANFGVNTQPSDQVLGLGP
jgi:hypothetical protein